MKSALLIVSFGTAVPGAGEAIRAVEEAMSAHAAGLDVFRAFTSPTIRRILAGRGEEIPGLEEALDRLAGEGYGRVYVQPTHLLYGLEYDKIRETAGAFRGRFQHLALGRPLVAGTEDLLALAGCFPPPERGGLVLLGHGTEHFANMMYPALQTALDGMWGGGVYVGTVEGWPGLEEVLARLRRDGHRSVLLRPLMLVAGDHAVSDMAGPGPESWKSRLEAAGLAVECPMEGLGLLKPVQEIYLRHLRELLENGV